MANENLVTVKDIALKWWNFYDEAKRGPATACKGIRTLYGLGSQMGCDTETKCGSMDCFRYIRSVINNRIERNK